MILLFLIDIVSLPFLGATLSASFASLSFLFLFLLHTEHNLNCRVLTVNLFCVFDGLKELLWSNFLIDAGNSPSMEIFLTSPGSGYCRLTQACGVACSKIITNLVWLCWHSIIVNVYGFLLAYSELVLWFFCRWRKLKISDPATAPSTQRTTLPHRPTCKPPILILPRHRSVCRFNCWYDALCFLLITMLWAYTGISRWAMMVKFLSSSSMKWVRFNWALFQ